VQLICEQVPYPAMQTLPCLEFPYPHRLDDELPEQRRDARPMTRGKGHRAPWSTGDAARRAGRCCSCPSGDAEVRRLSTRSSTPPRCYPPAHRWPSRCRQRRSCYSRSCHRCRSARSAWQGRSELNIVVVLSLPTFPSQAIASSLEYVNPPTAIVATGHASGWFFEYPGVPVPGCCTGVVKKFVGLVKSASWSWLAVP
jgi:hypothetical protein